MLEREFHPREPAGRWQSVIEPIDSYVTRIMCGLVLSLSFMVAAVHVPLDAKHSSVGWYVERFDERLTIDHIEHPGQAHDTEVPVTGLNDDNEKIDERPSQEQSQEVEVASSTGREASEHELRRVAGHKILDVAQQMPEIVGGLGAYYIHIEYPEAAIQNGIEGRLVLSFVVDTEGETSKIQVIKPLYPACDSAAVRALRRTRFVPGNQNGEPVQVRMRLPVRFQLLPRAGTRRTVSQESDA